MTIVQTLEIEDRRFGAPGRKTFDGPHVDQVLAAVRAMDQRNRTEVALRGPDSAYMVIGGGRGDYVVFIGNLVSGERLQLTRHRGSGEREIVAGGQLGKFAAAHIVDLAEAEQAARYFSERGTADPGLTWEQYWDA